MSNNRRQAFRCSVAELDARALLRISEGEVMASIVDESATGFGVECDRELAVHEGELAGLTTKTGQSICRVMRVEYSDTGKTSIGLQRVSEIEDEPEKAGGFGILARWFGRGAGSVLILVAFGLGMGLALGYAKFGSVPFVRSSNSSPERLSVPAQPTKRAAALAKSFGSLDDLKSRQFIKALKITDGQQRKIDTIVEKLVVGLANVHVDRGGKTPETYSHMGLLMIRRAWLQVEGTLTEEQMSKWDAILDGKVALPGADQAGL